MAASFPAEGAGGASATAGTGTGAGPALLISSPATPARPAARPASGIRCVRLFTVSPSSPFSHPHHSVGSEFKFSAALYHRRFPARKPETVKLAITG